MKQNALNVKFIFGLLKEAANDWLEDGALRLSAALAYYSIFSLAPLVLIAIGIAGFFGQNVGSTEIKSQLSGVMGPQMAEAVAGLVESASKSAKGATVVGFLLLIVGASGVFGQLKDALNTIWEVKQKAGAGIKGFIRERLLTFGMVLVIGFLLLTSLLIGAVLAGFSGWIEEELGMPGFIAGLIGFVFSFAIETLLFALIFRVLPDAEVGWRSVWIGAAVTAVLFEVGKWGLSLYLGSGTATSSFGAAGSVVLVLLWVYYTSLILFFGAEFTQVYAKAMGHEIRPSANAEPVTAEKRAQEGLPPGTRDTPPAPKPAIVTVPVYSPPPPATFPRQFNEVPAYLRDSPAASLLVAVGCGYTVGMIARALRKPEPDRTPTGEIAHGSKALALATLPLLTSIGRRVAFEAAKHVRPADWWKAARRVGKASASVARQTRRVKEWITPAILFALTMHSPGENQLSTKPTEEAVRLQIFLDNANFGPGKIDGRNGEFTRKALALYRRSQGLPEATTVDAKAPLDMNGIDVSTVDPVFTSYTIQSEDVQAVGELPDSRREQAKLEWLPYRTVMEAVAERFHTDIDYLKELNSGTNVAALKKGDTLTVPNVEPFELSGVKEIQPGAAIENPQTPERAIGDLVAPPERASAVPGETAISVSVSTKDNLLKVRDGERVLAAFPITSGSEQTASPIGEWKVQGVARLPDFRYDEKMLKEGERSSDFHLIPPGPNNPVGVIWIALNKKGVGIHGTDEPDTIGRSASHGCIRLANWDVAKLAGFVKTGVPVTIE